MAIRTLSSRTKSAYHLLQTLLRSPKNPHTFLSSPSHATGYGDRHCCNSNFRPFSSAVLCHQPQSSDSQPPNLINDLSRVLSDFRNPHHDIESALTPYASSISPDIVSQVLKRCKNLGFSAHRFFLWASRIPGFQHTKESHHILVDILGTSKQFPLIWDFLVESKRACSFEITPELFWVIFRAYCKANLPDDAIRAFNKMVDFGIRPSLSDLDALLFVLCKRKHVKHAQEFFDRVKADFSPSAKSYSILINGWGKVGESGEAQRLFDEMLERGCVVDLLACNSVLECLCKGGKVDEAYKWFKGIRSKGFEPDAYSYSIFIHAYCEANDVHGAFRVLDRMKRYKLVPNVYTYNCIINRLCRMDKVEEAYELLDEMIEKGAKPDVWSYNTILAYHCDHNEVNKALRLIARMDEDSCQLDRHTYNMVLKMLIRIGRFDRVEKVWEDMERRRFYPPVSTYAVMVHGLCKKKGKLEEACKYFEMMIDEGLPPYASTCVLLRNKLIGLGFAEQTEILADKMERSSSCPIRELSDIMRGNRTHVKSKDDEEHYTDESDE